MKSDEYDTNYINWIDVNIKHPGNVWGESVREESDHKWNSVQVYKLDCCPHYAFLRAGFPQLPRVLHLKKHLCLLDRLIGLEPDRFHSHLRTYHFKIDHQVFLVLPDEKQNWENGPSKIWRGGKSQKTSIYAKTIKRHHLLLYYHCVSLHVVQGLKLVFNHDWGQWVLLEYLWKLSQLAWKWRHQTKDWDILHDSTWDSLLFSVWNGGDKKKNRIKVLWVRTASLNCSVPHIVFYCHKSDQSGLYYFDDSWCEWYNDGFYPILHRNCQLQKGHPKYLLYRHDFSLDILSNHRLSFLCNLQHVQRTPHPKRLMVYDFILARLSLASNLHSYWNASLLDIFDHQNRSQGSFRKEKLGQYSR